MVEYLHNTLKSSWNLALQTEGWAAYFDHIREDLGEALKNSDFLKGGLDLITNIPSIDASNGISVRGYPNPIVNDIYIEIEGKHNHNLEVRIVDINGRIVFQKNMEQEEKFLQNGVFVLILKSEGEIVF